MSSAWTAGSIADVGASAAVVLAVDGAGLGVLAAGIAFVVGTTVALEDECAGLFRSGGTGSPVSITSSAGGATTSGAAIATGLVSLAESCLTASWLASASASRALMTGAVTSAAPGLAAVPERRCLRVLRWADTLKVDTPSLPVAGSVRLSRCIMTPTVLIVVLSLAAAVTMPACRSAAGWVACSISALGATSVGDVVVGWDAEAIGFVPAWRRATGCRALSAFSSVRDSLAVSLVFVAPLAIVPLAFVLSMPDVPFCRRARRERIVPCSSVMASEGIT